MSSVQLRCYLISLLVFLGFLIPACGGGDGNGRDGDGDDGGMVDARPCVGLECSQLSCPSGGTTSLSGTVYAPNGTLPLHNVTVYVPNGPLAPFPAGATCDRCDAVLSGNPLVRTTTDTMGRFELTDVPATTDVPLVIQVGKWRRMITLPRVTACEDTALNTGQTRLPRNSGEGDIPLMALTTGSADALECLVRKIGIDDSEFSNDQGTGRVHLYRGRGGTDQFDAALGGDAFGAATSLWGDAAKLKGYDVVLLSCEGDQDKANKPQSARQAMKEYADVGGRVFASHWHNYWIKAGPAPWGAAVTFDFLSDLEDITADIDTSFERGQALADWLVNVAASTVLGKIDINAVQHTVTGVTAGQAERWIYQDVTQNGPSSVQYLSFTTPLENPEATRCGRVVLSDIHVASGDESGGSLTFPSGGCTTDVSTMSPQEKVLAFMLFDIGSCLGPIID